jgi:hypothetical protein
VWLGAFNQSLQTPGHQWQGHQQDLNGLTVNFGHVLGQGEEWERRP